jgi:uncharacterized protein (DUF427 family)
MKQKFQDSAIAPIIAWDFDGMININGEDSYPECGEVRKYARDVMNLLHEIGVKNVIWTSRYVAYNQDEKKLYDHITPMIEFLDSNDIHYDAINKSVQFAPYAYNGRKIYAHMYVDDRAFGWEESDSIMLDILESILLDILGVCYELSDTVWMAIYNHTEIKEVYINDLKQYVEHWKD